MGGFVALLLWGGILKHETFVDILVLSIHGFLLSFLVADLCLDRPGIGMSHFLPEKRKLYESALKKLASVTVLSFTPKG